MRKLGLIFFIFILSVSQNVAESFDLGEAIKKIEEKEDLSLEQKFKIKRLIYRDWLQEESEARQMERKNKNKEDNELLELIYSKKDYATALQKADNAKYLTLGEKATRKREINLHRDISILSSNTQNSTIELKIKKLELELLSSIGDLRVDNDKLKLELLDIKHSLVSREIDLEDLKEKLGKQILQQ